MTRRKPKATPDIDNGSKIDPAPGQLIWRWSYRERRAIPLTYLGRNRTWRMYRHNGETWNENGLRRWFTNPTNCSWYGFTQACVAVAAFQNRTVEGRVEDAFDAACEYVRHFSDQFKKPAGQVWNDKDKPTPTPPAP